VTDQAEYAETVAVEAAADQDAHRDDVDEPDEDETLATMTDETEPDGEGALAEPLPEDFYGAFSAMFEALAAGAAEVLDLASALEIERRRVIVERAANSILLTAQHVAAVAALWIDEPDFVTPDGAPTALHVLEEDPGDLSCPRCERPISLMELRAVGICNRCEGANIPDLPVGSGDRESDAGAVTVTTVEGDGDHGAGTDSR
jgi:hypothetical protein